MMSEVESLRASLEVERAQNRTLHAAIELLRAELEAARVREDLLSKEWDRLLRACESAATLLRESRREIEQGDAKTQDVFDPKAGAYAIGRPIHESERGSSLSLPVFCTCGVSPHEAYVPNDSERWRHLVSCPHGPRP